MRAPTKAEHDAYVAARGRSYTADHMRKVKTDEPSIDPFSVVDRVIAQARRGNP